MRVAHFYFTAHVRYNTMSITAQRATKGNIAMALASAGKSLTEIAPALKRVETKLNGDVAKASRLAVPAVCSSPAFESRESRDAV